MFMASLWNCAYIVMVVSRESLFRYAETLGSHAAILDFFLFFDVSGFFSSWRILYLTPSYTSL